MLTANKTERLFQRLIRQSIAERAQLEAETSRLERKLSRHGFARRSWGLGLDMATACVLSVAIVLGSLAQIGGAL